MGSFKRMSKSIVFLIVLLFVGGNVVYANDIGSIGSKGTQLSENEIDELMSKGLSREAVESFVIEGYSYDDIDSMEFIASETKYYKITETYPKELEPQDLSSDFEKNTYQLMLDNAEDNFTSTVEEISYNDYIKGTTTSKEDTISPFAVNESHTSYKSMTTSITKINSERYKVWNLVLWKKLPLHRKIDIIGIGINSNTSPIPGTEYAKQTWGDFELGKSGSAVYTATSPKWDRGGKGYGISFNLKSDERYLILDYAQMAMQYEIKPNVSNVTTLDAYGHYAHQESAIAVTPSFNVLTGTLSIDAKHVNKYTFHPKVHVQISR